MSNFICSECGKNIIDCGHGNLKTDREIELEKKLEIAVKALEEIKEYSGSYFLKERDVEYSENTIMRIGCIVSLAQAKIKEIKG